MLVGYLLIETPRYFVQVLGLKSWDQVCAYMDKRKPPVPLSEMSRGDDPPSEKAKQKFKQLLSDKGGATVLAEA